jgi:hypothetical protein
MKLFDPSGFVIGDIGLGIIATVCAAWCYVELAMHRHDDHDTFRLWLELAARWMVALGWTIIAIRIWYALATIGDAPVAAVSVIALALVGSGWITLNIARAR